MAMIKKIEISDEYVTLGQFLKIADLIQSGGEAKAFILSNKILVNGEEEDRRGRKLRKNDRIQIDRKVYEIC